MDILERLKSSAKWFVQCFSGKVPFVLILHGEIAGITDRMSINSVKSKVDTSKFENSVLVISEDLCAVYEIDTPLKLKPEDAAGVIRYENLTRSPFKETDTVFGWEMIQRGANKFIRVYLTSRQICGREIKACGLALDGNLVDIGFVGANDVLIISNWTANSNRVRVAKRISIINWIFLLLIVVGALSIAASPMVRKWLVLQDANLRYGELTKSLAPTLKIRERLLVQQDLLEIFRQKENSYQPPHAVLATLTSVLPDNTFLFSAEVGADSVRIHGQTPNAAGLMARLSAQVEFADVKAIAPSTKAPGASGETFQLVISLASKSKEASR